jgi:predicted nucleotidyltransferase
MTIADFDRVNKEFRNEIKYLRKNISKKFDTEARLKEIYDCVKKDYANTLNLYYAINFDEYHNYVKQYSEFLLEIVDTYFTLKNLSKSIEIGVAGSTAKNLSDINSDLDIVIQLNNCKSESNVNEKIIISELINFFSTNVDLVKIKTYQARSQFPEDIIDGMIALSPHVVFISKKPYKIEKRILSENQINQIFLDDLLLKFIPLPPEKNNNDIKYRMGGLRDIVFIIENAGRVSLGNEEYQSQMHPINCMSRDNYVLLKMKNLSNQIDDEETQKIIFNNIKNKNKLIKYFFEKRLNISYSFYEELLQRSVSHDYFSLEESKKILYSHKYKRFELLILSLTMDVDKIIKFSGNVSKRIAYSLIANRYTSSSILHNLALKTGYDWRNIRDQVLKHPNITSRTIHLLLNDEMPYTRNRASSLIN